MRRTARLALPIVLGALAASAACSTSSSAPPPSAFDASAADGATDAGNGASFEGSIAPDPDASPFASCATGSTRAIFDPVYMLFVVDASGSMSQDGKWGAVVPALELFIDLLAQRKDTTFGVGLTIFSDTNDPTKGMGPYPGFDVPIAYVDAAHGAALHARLAQAAPKYDTPTLAVLTGQYGALETFAPQPPLQAGGKKVLVFMTDGVPYPDPSGTEQQQCIQAATNELAKPAPAGPITTMAVGVGYFFPYDPVTYDVKFMGELAKRRAL